MPNPSSTQVIEPREQIGVADDAGGVNCDRIWAVALFSGEHGNTRGQRSHQTTVLLTGLAPARSTCSPVSVRMTARMWQLHQRAVWGEVPQKRRDHNATALLPKSRQFNCCPLTSVRSDRSRGLLPSAVQPSTRLGDRTRDIACLLLRLILWPRIHVPHPFNENLFCKLRIDIRVY